MTTAIPQLPRLHNGQPAPLADVPVLPFAAFREAVVTRAVGATRLAALFGHERDDGRVRLFAALADGEKSVISPLAADLPGESYPSLTPDCPQAHHFEREIAEQWGVVPLGHPWLKPLRYHHSYRPGRDAWGRADDAPILPCVTDHFRVEGPEIHEVAVGPVHAGVIEPGSFRFQCHGEHVFHLEIHLGYQHRGVERALVGGPNKRTLHYMETLAGDTTIGHATAYCQAVEGLAGAADAVSTRAHAIRGIALELERLACHTGDLGALADDVGYLPTANYCGRLRGDFLNATGTICGNRFGRSLVRPGGVAFDIDPAMAQLLIERLRPALRDVGGAAQLLWNSFSVLSRFENVGVLTRNVAEALGIVGVPLRAAGSERDARLDFPSGIFRAAEVPVATWPTGDVFARAYVRWLEIERSGQFVLDHLHTLHTGPTRGEIGPLAADALVVSLVEGWRGPICHVAITDGDGRFARYKVVDPSFQNWTGLMFALRDQQISDFPLCNKSFNLSYCGHDL
jgi:Ni,Fe-hydrogenase III large subunit